MGKLRALGMPAQPSAVMIFDLPVASLRQFDAEIRDLVLQGGLSRLRRMCGCVPTPSCGVTSAHVRLDGYIRVSQVRGRAGDRFISPGLQRDRIESWCRAHGHELVMVHEELDRSAGRGRIRPKFEAMLQRVIRQETDGVVIWKASRFGRAFRESINNIYDVREAGGIIVSVDDGLDTSDKGGRLALNIFLSVAEDQLDDVRQGWRDAKARAVERGIHPSATPPFGYRRETEGQTPAGRPKLVGPLLVDPVTGPLVTEVFRRRADGVGLTELGRWLGEQGATTQQGRPRFSLRAVRDIVRNRVYLGIAYAGDVENPDAHEALTDPDTFRRAQRPGVGPAPTGVSTTIVRPLLRCAGCRYAVRAEFRRQARGNVWIYSCRSSTRDAAWYCVDPVSMTVAAEALDNMVVDEFISGLPALTERARGLVPGLERLEREEARHRALLAEWRDDSRVQERLGMDAYLNGLEARQTAHERVSRDLAAARAAADAPALTVEVADVAELWPTLDDSDRRELLTAGLTCVFIRGKQLGRLPLSERVRLVWRDEPVRLPMRGDREFVAHPFDFDGGTDGDRPELSVAREQDPRED